MKELFKKKLFLEIYIPIAIVVSPFLALLVGFVSGGWHWGLSFVICLGVAILIRFSMQRRRSSAKISN
jgi:phosphate starvation-inducible membrane PsiE